MFIQRAPHSAERKTVIEWRHLNRRRATQTRIGKMDRRLQSTRKRKP